MVARANHLLVALITLGALAVSLNQSGLVEARQNYGEEPLFTDQDDRTGGDIHTVSAGSNSRPPPPPPSRVSPQPAPSASSLLPLISTVQPQSSRGLPQPQLASDSASRLVELGRTGPAGTAKRQTSSPVNRPDELTAARQQQYARQKAEPKHWSALEDYYAKLRAKSGVGWYEIGEESTSSSYGPDDEQSPARELDPPYSRTGLSPLLPMPKTPNDKNTPFRFPAGPEPKTLYPLPRENSNVAPVCRCEPASTGVRNFAPDMQQDEQSAWSPEADDYWPVSPDRDFMKEVWTRQNRRQDMLGPWVAPSMQEHFLYDELNCGPRNRVRGTARARLVAANSGTNFGEYPSHMGLYNGTTPNDDNFLCSATLVHPRFALTLASCLVVKNSNYNLSTSTTQQEPQLTIQTGDWNINRGATEGERQAAKATMATRQVARVHPFPRFDPQSQSSEHNLALVEWTEPLDFAKNNYISPACQVGSRSSLRMARCWAPIRNETFIEIYNPHGDGETILVKKVQMVEMPINLIARNDLECRNKTKIESFNLQRPNQICSGDFWQSQWRNRLKSSRYLGSGVYCNENGMINLVSLMSPIPAANATILDPSIGYLDLSFYSPWIKSLISAASKSSRMDFIN